MILIDESPSWGAIIFAVYVDVRSCKKSATETVYGFLRRRFRFARQCDVPHMGGELLAG